MQEAFHPRLEAAGGGGATGPDRFGTNEGHTRAFGHFAAGVLGEAGFPIAAEPAGLDSSQPSPAPYDVALLAASLQVGNYQAPLVAYARQRHEARNEDGGR